LQHTLSLKRAAHLLPIKWLVSAIAKLVNFVAEKLPWLHGMAGELNLSGFLAILSSCFIYVQKVFPSFLTTVAFDWQ
jgi:hypothetical protein